MTYRAQAKGQTIEDIDIQNAAATYVYRHMACIAGDPITGSIGRQLFITGPFEGGGKGVNVVTPIVDS